MSECERCQLLEDELRRREDEISGLQTVIRGQAFKLEQLKRDKAGSAKTHPKYADAEIVFREWKRHCNHPRSGFTAARFWLILPFLENEKFGMKACLLAIKGAAYDPFETRRKNGTVKRHDSWEKIFESAGTLEDFANRAPRAQQAMAV